MIGISILGTGKVAGHLVQAFSMSDGARVLQIIGRNANALKRFESRVPTANFGDWMSTAQLKKRGETDVWIIAVSDDAIARVSEFLKDVKGLVVHTSGSVPMDALSPHVRRGVFYPLQTFSKERNVNLQSVPFCLEAKEDADLALLKKLAGELSEKVYDVDSRQRKALHLAAVFVNNFTNHLFHIGQDLCQKQDLPFEILQPLILETVEKIRELPPLDAQTGPARRGDALTIENHLNQLQGSNFEEVYLTLSNSIITLYGVNNSQ